MYEVHGGVAHAFSRASVLGLRAWSSILLESALSEESIYQVVIRFVSQPNPN